MSSTLSPEERQQRRREVVRRYQERNRDKIRERREANRERHREWNRKWKAANRDRVNAQQRARYAANIEESRARNRPRNAVTRHGPDAAAVIAAMWEQQGGKCYLCGIYLVPDAMGLDHDHRCCPRNRSCQYCRRGLACDYCNVMISRAHDDPAVLRLVANNLEAKLAEIDARLATKPSQLTLESTS